MRAVNAQIPHTAAEIDWASWEPTEHATLLFVLEPTRMLLIRKKRGLGAGKINAPGGRLDPGETPLQAAVREVQEELHVTALDPRRRGDHRFQFLDGYSLYVTVFSSTRYEGVPTETDEAVPLWIDNDAIPYDEMWADDRLWVPVMLEGNDFSTRSIFDGDVMLDFEMEVTRPRG
jgi:8-oxo-dGTP diphosphatase